MSKAKESVDAIARAVSDKDEDALLAAGLIAFENLLNNIERIAQAIEKIAEKP